MATIKIFSHRKDVIMDNSKSIKSLIRVMIIGCLFSMVSCSEDDVTCTEINWYQDLDEDGFGNADVSLSSCIQPEGYVADNTDTNDASSDFAITSEAIVDGELLDAFKCESKTNDIENSIPLTWTGVPSNTGSLAIVMIHYPNADDLTNLNSYILLWNIDPSVSEIPYGTADDGPWYIGANKDGTAISYTSPCSPSSGSHEYTIRIYALSETPATLPEQSTLEVTYEVLAAAIETVTVIGTAELTFNDVN
jgi:phosphatidylethanolamine-binding protein (PEBP) family uncharacterized protein